MKILLSDLSKYIGVKNANDKQILNAEINDCKSAAATTTNNKTDTLSETHVQNERELMLRKINILNDIGYEIEIHDIRTKLKDFIVGQIKECSKVDGANKLNLCVVTDGKQDFQIICGAPNVRPGLKIVLAKVKTIMPDGMVIRKAIIRGIESSGMICSARELDLSNEHDGIYELSNNAKVGDTVINWIHCEAIIDVEITPDKTFANNIFGIANELIRTGAFFAKPALYDFKNVQLTVVKLVNEINQSCMKYDRKNDEYSNENNDKKSHAKHDSESEDNEKKDIEIKKFAAEKITESENKNRLAHAAYWMRFNNVNNTSSPQWLMDKLYLLGITSHSFIVDIMNYITYLTGQPLHVYDAHKIDGELKICQGIDKKNFIGLDDEKYSIEKNELVICDEKKICAIAGLIGSKDTAVNANTKDIIIEAAAFDRLYFVKHSIDISKAYGLFHKGVPGNQVFDVLHKIKQVLMHENIVNAKNLVEIYGWHYEKKNRKIYFNINQYKDLIGMNLDINKFIKLFSTQGFQLEYQDSVSHDSSKNMNDTKNTKDTSHNNTSATKKEYIIKIAENRSDIMVQQDIIAEYLRFSNDDNKCFTNENIKNNCDEIIGLNSSMPQENMHTNTTGKSVNANDKNMYTNSIIFRFTVAKLFAKIGYDEVMTWSFGSKEQNSLLTDNIIEIQNPISVNLSVLNASNYGNLLNIAKENLSRLETGFKFFTIAPLFEYISNKTHKQEQEHKQEQKQKHKPKEEKTKQQQSNNIKQIYHVSGIVHLEKKNIYHNKNTEVDFYDVKGDLELFLNELGFNNISFIACDYSKYTNKYQTAKVIVNRKQEIGIISVLYPQDDLLFFELDIEMLHGFLKKRKSLKITDKHPIYRDFCFVINENTYVGNVMNTIQQIQQITQVELLDRHDANQTITVRVRIDSEVNMNKDNIKKIEDKIESNVLKKHNLKLKV